MTSGRIFCIGHNYREHILELGSPFPEEPVVFMKPMTSLLSVDQVIPFPSHGRELHFETEIVVEIGKQGKKIEKDKAREYIRALALGLDLTLRDVQKKLKANGYPWEISKAFDGSATLGEKCIYDATSSLYEIDLQCWINGELRQKGESKEMVFDIETIIAYLSQLWELIPGDLIFTGTPSGVGSLHPGDQIELKSSLLPSSMWKVESAK